MYPTTGWFPQEKKICVRCRGVNDNPLQQLCDTCRKGDALEAYFHDDELIKAARAIREYWDMSLLDKKLVEQYCMSGYETPMQIRASLGI